MRQSPTVSGHTLIHRAAAERLRGRDERERLEARKADTVLRFIRAWETGDFGSLVSILTEDAVVTMAPWVYWLDDREAVAAMLQSSGVAATELSVRRRPWRATARSRTDPSGR
jgi:hypothetical protein